MAEKVRVPVLQSVIELIIMICGQTILQQLLQDILAEEYFSYPTAAACTSASSRGSLLTYFILALFLYFLHDHT